MERNRRQHQVFDAYNSSNNGSPIGGASRGSSDSLVGFEVVPRVEPELRIGGDGSVEDLQQNLREVLSSSDSSLCVDEVSVSSGRIIMPTGVENKCRADSLDVEQTDVNGSEDDQKSAASQTRHLSLPLVSPGSESKVFSGIVYLGAASINAPRSQTEIHRNMAILNEQSSGNDMEVKLSIPVTSEGNVVLYEMETNADIASFKVHRIIFCARGLQDTGETSCFAFTCSHGASAETAIFQCHVFRCHQPDDVSRVLLSFSLAFSRVPQLPRNQYSKGSATGQDSGSEKTYTLEVTLELKEEDAKGNFNSCPKDKNYFKLKCNWMRKVHISVQQVCANKELVIERCFGLLVTPGRNVMQGDMQLLEAVSMTTVVGERKVYSIVGNWDPTDPNFEVLNTETPKDTRVYMTVAVDLVIHGIQEPVRFIIETKAKIYPQNERFWYFSKRTLTEQFLLKLKEVDVKTSDGLLKYEVIGVECAGEVEHKKAGLLTNLKNPLTNWQTPLSPGDPEDESDSDEPLLSGSGEVSKECSELELDSWADVLSKWRQNLSVRPRLLHPLVHKGIPEALRGEVWLLLAGCHEDDGDRLLDTYRVLITKESPCEQVIQRDINRTFPAHDFFKEAGGLGQDSLYRISKAYSIYDEEVGYCQGLSFLAASLLLHMPEEQAFSVLVKVMFDYQLRDLFKDNFDTLHSRFYQLERLIQDHLTDLYEHFQKLGIEAHMFCSQWFLTLFTAKFPLFLVFHILDVFLCEGIDTIFQVSLGLLMMSKKELLLLDFEGVLKYFRVSLPKKYRSEETARQLMRTAVTVKVKKSKKYEKDFVALKEQERQEEDPVKRFTRENKQLMQANLRLEQENDDLAYELVTSKIELRRNLDELEDKAECLTKELATKSTMLRDCEEEKRRLETEAAQLKEMCRRELQRCESEITRNAAIIFDYKQICSQLSARQEKEQATYKETLDSFMVKVNNCKTCSKALNDVSSVAPDLNGAVSPTRITAALTAEDTNGIGTTSQVRELELELAQTKLALVEAECRNQELTHQLNSVLSELQTSKNTWFHKTLSSIRDATKKESIHGGVGTSSPPVSLGHMIHSPAPLPSPLISHAASPFLSTSSATKDTTIDASEEI